MGFHQALGFVLSAAGLCAFTAGLTAQAAHARSEILVSEFKHAVVEELSYTGKGEFVVVLRTGNPEIVRKLGGDSDEQGRLKFILAADVVTGFQYSFSGRDKNSLRDDVPMSGIELVNLLVKLMKSGVAADLSIALDQSDPDSRVRRLGYFQINGIP